MPLPQIVESSRTPIVTPQWPEEPAGVGFAPPPAATLPLSMQRQEQTNWCWAAVAHSVSHLVGPSSWQQCTIANEVLQRNDCCFNGASAACNQPARLDAALAATGNLREAPITDPLPFTPDLVREIGGYRLPVACWIAWRGGGGHFVAINAYWVAPSGASAVPFVSVIDPSRGRRSLPYEQFRQQYCGAGRWAWSYLTKGA